MEKYRMGIQYFEKALKISPDRIHPEKRDEVHKHREAMKRNLDATKGRLSDLGSLNIVIMICSDDIYKF